MLYCHGCAERHDEKEPIWRCRCGGFLIHGFEVTPSIEPVSLRHRSSGWWRYREALPLSDERHITSLGETATEMRSGTIAGERVTFKLEGQCPTGSFKDRGSFLMISKFREWGLREIVEDSSGNAGASVAAYCRAAGITARIYAPSYTPSVKIANIARYEPEITLVEGTREDTALQAEQAGQESYYASHNWNPYFTAGVKTLAYEIWEQMDFRVPQQVVVPVGGGSSLLGLYYGFKELRDSGRIDTMPRLIGVQAEACEPLTAAFLRGDRSVRPAVKGPTMAEGIVIADPPKGSAILEAIYASGGLCLSVSEEEISQSIAGLCEQSLAVEPTSAVAAAGYRKGVALGMMAPEATVIVLTGKSKK